VLSMSTLHVHGSMAIAERRVHAQPSLPSLWSLGTQTLTGIIEPYLSTPHASAFFARFLSAVARRPVPVIIVVVVVVVSAAHVGAVSAPPVSICTSASSASNMATTGLLTPCRLQQPSSSLTPRPGPLVQLLASTPCAASRVSFQLAPVSVGLAVHQASLACSAAASCSLRPLHASLSRLAFLSTPVPGGTDPARPSPPAP
jgi:hypothetical protein